MGANVDLKYEDGIGHTLFRTFSTDKAQPIQLWSDWFQKPPHILDAKQEIKHFCEFCQDTVTFNRVNLDE